MRVILWLGLKLRTVLLGLGLGRALGFGAVENIKVVANSGKVVL